MYAGKELGNTRKEVRSVTGGRWRDDYRGTHLEGGTRDLAEKQQQARRTHQEHPEQKIIRAEGNTVTRRPGREKDEKRKGRQRRERALSRPPTEKRAW